MRARTMDQPSFKKTMPPTNVALPRKSRKRLASPWGGGHLFLSNHASSSSPREFLCCLGLGIFLLDDPSFRTHYHERYLFSTSLSCTTALDEPAWS